MDSLRSFNHQMGAPGALVRFARESAFCLHFFNFTFAFTWGAQGFLLCILSFYGQTLPRLFAHKPLVCLAFCFFTHGT
jgi:hypothetical protein